MSKSSRVALGLDFGTESVRALLVDLAGNERGSAVVKFRHGQITETLPSATATAKKAERLPPDFALQHPADWIDSSKRAVRRALRQAGVDKESVVGIGVDFTSCTMFPATADGTPLSEIDRYSKEKYAWPKLWKHHGAKSQTDRINELARKRRERWRRLYGGGIGLEWMFPKILETLERAPRVYSAADVFVEAGDWFVWKLVGGDVADLPRSTCQAGYKALWNGTDGYPSRAFFKALHPKMKTFSGQTASLVLRDFQTATRLSAAVKTAGSLLSRPKKQRVWEFELSSLSGTGRRGGGLFRAPWYAGDFPAFTGRKLAPR